MHIRCKSSVWRPKSVSCSHTRKDNFDDEDNLIRESEKIPVMQCPSYQAAQHHPIVPAEGVLIETDISPEADNNSRKDPTDYGNVEDR